MPAYLPAATRGIVLHSDEVQLRTAASVRTIAHPFGILERASMTGACAPAITEAHGGLLRLLARQAAREYLRGDLSVEVQPDARDNS